MWRMWKQHPMWQIINLWLQWSVWNTRSRGGSKTSPVYGWATCCIRAVCSMRKPVKLSSFPWDFIRLLVWAGSFKFFRNILAIFSFRIMRWVRMNAEQSCNSLQRTNFGHLYRPWILKSTAGYLQRSVSEHAVYAKKANAGDKHLNGQFLKK